MSQVSHRYLNPKVEQQIFQIFIESFASLPNTSIATEFLYDLLSPVEQVMLGKRLAISYMLLKGYSQRVIADTLKVSQPTVTRVNSYLKSGSGYKKIISHMLKQEKIVAFFDSLEAKLDHFLPPKGVNWKAHFARTDGDRAKRRKAF